jgi:hypothetical protein
MGGGGCAIFSCIGRLTSVGDEQRDDPDPVGMMFTAAAARQPPRVGAARYALSVLVFCA